MQAGQEWQEHEPFLDKLNRLEKLHAIPSVGDWLMLRDLRNSAMHEYPDQPEINAANLNRIFSSVATLEQALDRAKAYARERYLNDEGMK